MVELQSRDFGFSLFAKWSFMSANKSLSKLTEVKRTKAGLTPCSVPGTRRQFEG